MNQSRGAEVPPQGGRRPVPARVDPAAEPFRADPPAGGVQDLAVLFCHGFTGSPASMVPWAQATHAAGYPVSVPRLPGHGTSWHELRRTSWQDWYATVEREYLRLAERYARVAVTGLSMGGALALRLAERHPVAGVVLVNPAVMSSDKRLRVLPLLGLLTPSVAAIGADIAKEGQDEHAYHRTPVRATASMLAMWTDVRDHLDAVTAPVLMLTSDTDHVVDPSSAELLERRLAHLRRVRLQNSFHVATLDHDAELIETETIAFLQGL